MSSIHTGDQHATLLTIDHSTHSVNGDSSSNGSSKDLKKAATTEEDVFQEYTKCNSCWGHCMPKKCCECWFNVWPCCRPIGRKIPPEDPLRPQANLRLLVFTLIGISCGLIGGFVASELKMSKFVAHYVGIPGELLLRALKCVVLFLIPCSIISGISKLSGGSTGRLGIRAFLYYLATTVISATFGILWVTLIQPGYFYADKIKPPVAAPEAPLPPGAPIPPKPPAPSLPPVGNIGDSIVNMLFAFIPDNIIVAMANLNILGLITISIALGVVLNALGKKGKPMLKLILAGNHIIHKLIDVILYYVPIGVCFIIISKLGESETGTFIQKLEALGLFALTVIAGLLVHGYLMLPGIYFICTQKNPYKWIKGMAQALLTAFATASSAATLPITMKCVYGNGVDASIAEFVLPFGATMSMDGTALYEAVAAIFIAQLTGKVLTIVDLITISITATLAALGAAGVPEAGLITISIVLTAVGLPLDNIGLLLTIDWFLDRVRTTVNVLGDSFGCGVIDHIEGKRLAKERAIQARLQAVMVDQNGTHNNDDDDDDDDHGEASLIPRGTVDSDLIISPNSGSSAPSSTHLPPSHRSKRSDNDALGLGVATDPTEPSGSNQQSLSSSTTPLSSERDPIARSPPSRYGSDS